MNAVVIPQPRTANADRVAYDRERAMIWFSRHLWDMTGVNVQAGATNPQQRADNIRNVLVDKAMTDAVMGRFNGKPETYGEFVKRALGINIGNAAQAGLF